VTLLRVLALLVLAAGPAAAQDGDADIAFGGRLQTLVGARVGDPPDVLLARTRADGTLRIGFDGGRAFTSARLTYDARTERARGELREAYLDLFWSRLDLRLGRQVFVWGTTDGAFVTDQLAPLDLSEFVVQDVEDLRLGVLAAQATLYTGDFRWTAVAIPVAPTSRLPEAGSPWYPLPEAVLGVPLVVEPAERPRAALDNAEAALRVTYRGIDRTDLSLMAFWGHHRVPAFRKGVRVTWPEGVRLTATPVYHRRLVMGLSGESTLLDPLVLRAEAAFHTSHLFDQPVEIPQSLAGLLDPDFQEALGRGFLVEKPLGQAALGAERAFGAHLLRVQAMAAYVFDHDARVAQRPFEPSVSGFYLGRFRRETVTAQAFALVNLARGDYWLHPSLSYAVRDALTATLGAHVFGGPDPAAAGLPGLLREPAFSFATFGRNDLLYLRLTYSW
jgi:hypothetical protein